MRDYGCAWSGACGKDTLPRETVRSALEWGVNVAIASVQVLDPLCRKNQPLPFRTQPSSR